MKGKNTRMGKWETIPYYSPTIPYYSPNFLLGNNPLFLPRSATFLLSHDVQPTTFLPVIYLAMQTTTFLLSFLSVRHT
jgi:hypothetical protein